MSNDIKKKELVLEGHKDAIWSVAITPDGKQAVSCSVDQTLRVWDLDTGKCLSTWEGHNEPIYDVAVTPNGKAVVSGSSDCTMRVWHLETGEPLQTLPLRFQIVRCIKITPDGKKIVSGSDGNNLKVWNLETGQCLKTIKGQTDSVSIWDLAVTPDGKKIISGSFDNTLNIWNLETGECLQTLQGHKEGLSGIAVTPDGKRIVSGSYDSTLKLWDLETGQCIATWEGHTNRVFGIAITPDGRQVLSGSKDKTINIWDIQTGHLLANLRGHKEAVYGIAITPDGKRVVSCSKDKTLRVWELSNYIFDYKIIEVSEYSRYTNAKVILLGESGVGKTGLAIRLAENRWENTETIYGTQVWPLRVPNSKDNVNMQSDLWLWDFAGQPDYRLTNQLYMGDTTLALIVINPQDDNPFEKLGHWEKALNTAVKRDLKKILVAARCDLGGMTVSRDVIKAYCSSHGYNEFSITSAKNNLGCDELKAAIATHIPWNSLPPTSSTKLFKALKNALIHMKGQGNILIRISELKSRLQLLLPDDQFQEEDVRAAAVLLAGQGIIQVLDFGNFVLLQPELINNYASIVVRTAREHPLEIGSVSKMDVLEGRLNYNDMKRIDKDDEKILLRAMLQTFFNFSLCIEEETAQGTQLVFPSYFKRRKPKIPNHPPILVAYEFSGSLDLIYASLVVRLSYTDSFKKKQFWKNAADFETYTDKQVGFLMESKSVDTAKLDVYFEAGVPVDTQVSFIKYIHEHLMKKAENVKRIRYYICPDCNEPLRDQIIIQRKIDQGKIDIICQACESWVPLTDQIEEKFKSQNILKAVQKMDEKATQKLDNESRELVLDGQAKAITGEAGQIYRDISQHDWGIDAEIEFKNDHGEACGMRVYLQLKSGDSYLYDRKWDEKKIFRIKNPRHARYWQEHAYPVMLVIKTSDDIIRWMNVTDFLKKHGKKTKEIVFDGEPFNASSVLRLRDKLLKIQ